MFIFMIILWPVSAFITMHQTAKNQSTFIPCTCTRNSMAIQLANGMNGNIIGGGGGVGCGGAGGGKVGIGP